MIWSAPAAPALAILLLLAVDRTSTHCATQDVVSGYMTDRQLIGCGAAYTENVLWNLDRADATLDGLATRVTHGAGAVVYVIDSGVEISHDEFQRDGGTTNVIAGLDPPVEMSSAAPPKGCPDDSATHPCYKDLILAAAAHGTAVASVVSGRTTGIAPGAKIVAVRVLTPRNVSADVTQTDLWMRALDDIVRHAFDPSAPPFRTAIVNMSGGPAFTSPADPAWIAFRDKMALMIGGVDASFHADPGGKRFLFVASAGNNGPAQGPLKLHGQCTASNDVAYYPAAAGREIDGLITVAGIDRSNAFWSGSCGGAAIDIVAPAENILCATPAGHDLYRGMIKNSDGTFEDLASGTSYAAPYVAGIAARILESDPNLTPAEIERRIKETADRGVAVLAEAPPLPRHRAALH